MMRPIPSHITGHSNSLPRELWEALEEGLSNRQRSSVHGHRFVQGILALRPAVVARKISGGSRSWRGARVFAVLATVVQTLQLRSRDLIRGGPGYLASARW